MSARWTDSGKPIPYPEHDELEPAHGIALVVFLSLVILAAVIVGEFIVRSVG